MCLGIAIQPDLLTNRYKTPQEGSATKLTLLIHGRYQFLHKSKTNATLHAVKAVCYYKQ
jgi:hypothetical protein